MPWHEAYNRAGAIGAYYRVCMFVYIKTHNSESRGQEEAGHMQRTSELFTHSTGLKFVNTLNKPS